MEDGATLAENAAKKAVEAASRTGLVAVGDDTGLEVAALGGRPGVHTARYAGPGATFGDNNRKLLAELGPTPERKRGACFRCVVAVAAPRRGPEGGRRSEVLFTVEGRCDGSIAERPRGDEGFGYDPVFVVSGLGKTFAELPAEVKHEVSHRGRAFRALRERLPEIAALGSVPPGD